MEQVKKKERRSNFRTLVVLIFIVATAGTLFSPYIPRIIFVPLIFLIMGGISYRYLKRILVDNEAIDDYTQAGKSAVASANIISFVALGLVFYVVYLLIRAAFIFFDEDSFLYPFAITIFLLILTVRIADIYAGKDMEMYLNYNKMSRDRYVNSLGPVDQKCMSCTKKIDPTEEYCPHCGFKQKRVSGGKGYIKQ